MKNAKLPVYLAGAVICSFLGAVALGYDAYPVYVVDVAENGQTNLLSAATVDVYATAETQEPEKKPFQELSLTAGTLVKRGAGWLLSEGNLPNFKGTVEIEAGVMCADRALSFGPSDSTAGAIWVRDGATLACDPKPGVCANYQMFIYNTVHVAGRGHDGKGAIQRVMPITSVNGRETFYGQIVLEGDALVNCGGSSQGLGDKSGKTKAYLFNGHTLIVTNGTWCINSAVLDAQNGPAGIVLEPGPVAGNLQWQSGVTFKGDEASVFQVKSNTVFHGYNATGITAPWTLQLDGGAAVKLGGSEEPDYWKTYATKRNQWSGPIRVDGETLIDGNTTYGNMHFSAIGPVSGPGGFQIKRGFLNLFNPGNDFTGAVSLYAQTYSCNACLALWDPGAWPKDNRNEIKSTNGSICLATDGVYELPKLNMNVSEQGTNSHVFGNGVLTVPAFVKRGVGKLDITAPLTVTGRTEVTGGTLEINVPAMYSDAPGLWESLHLTNAEKWPSAELKAYYTDGTLAETNGVTSYPLMAEVYTNLKTEKDFGTHTWTNNMSARYEGYIWNREPTNAVYGFALAFCANGKLYIDDRLVLEGQGNWYFLRTNSVELTTGPHKFDLRLYTTTYSDPGARYQTVTGKQDFRFFGDFKSTEDKTVITDVVWDEPNKGFVWRLGAATPKCADYEVPANGSSAVGGNGFVFTRTPDVLPELLSPVSFSNLACTAGTVIDLKDSGALVVPAFEGFTTVSNGTLHVKESWKVGPETPGLLKVGGRLVFDPGATFDLVCNGLKHGNYVIAEATDGIEGFPDYVPGDDRVSQGWHLVKEKNAAGHDVLRLYWQSGAVIIVR